MAIITVKVSKDVAELLEKMISLGIARSKNEAINIMIEHGRAEIERRIREEEEVRKLVEMWLKEGYPCENLDASDLREERYG
ncbi:hypothetical protein [Metallosphaera hakonensis]|uniref:VapB-type antitoxin n=1 Tax=Metallosphaera hakonensis JCM 8857 = DSM 7519 TaxID=1293036 RepID=A0A2U9IR51_9CREN|nr:hypothetical protein [Metallosphaera hakonensis]AWR98521.1 VapB-type antitoxin [Metallosphaera hakonensis JCM 8857 = DSM 7519]